MVVASREALSFGARHPFAFAHEVDPVARPRTSLHLLSVSVQEDLTFLITCFGNIEGGGRM